MDSYFVFNGYNSLDYNIVIQEENLPPVEDGEEEFEFIEVPGRDGYLTLSKDRIRPITKSIKCALIDETKKDEVRNWLKGAGTLIVCNEHDVYYNCRVRNSVKFYHHWSKGWEFEVEFYCQPEKFVVV